MICTLLIHRAGLVTAALPLTAGPFSLHSETNETAIPPPLHSPFSFLLQRARHDRHSPLLYRFTLLITNQLVPGYRYYPRPLQNEFF